MSNFTELMSQYLSSMIFEIEESMLWSINDLEQALDELRRSPEYIAAKKAKNDANAPDYHFQNAPKAAHPKDCH